MSLEKGESSLELRFQVQEDTGSKLPSRIQI